MSANDIVIVNVSQQNPGAPSRLQRTGAAVSQGGTTLAAGDYALISEFTDITSILSASIAIAAMAWASNVATITTTTPHGWPIGDQIKVFISGCVPTAYNGHKTVTVTDTTHFTYPLVGAPGSQVTTGQVINADEEELVAMFTTFFEQGAQQAAYVLELGPGDADTGVAALATWITANTGFFYSYLVPSTWDGNANFLTFLGGFNTTTAKTYFHVFTDTTNYVDYTSTMKCVLASVSAPTAPSTEFEPAAQWWQTLSNNPGASNQVPPLNLRFVYGVTPYPLKGNATLLATLKTANIGYIDTGAEGGLSNTILKWGRTLDGKPFNYWYSLDWAQINFALALANAAINGSNTSINPLYYNQNGINRLQDVCTGVAQQGVSAGLALGTIINTQLPLDEFVANANAGLYAGQLVINAIPFARYTADNPTNYADEVYGGLAALWTPQVGFSQIILNLQATLLV